MGNVAKSTSRRCFTLVKVTTPTAPSTPLPTKFAVAEKHIGGCSVARLHTCHRRTQTFFVMGGIGIQIFHCISSTADQLPFSNCSSSEPQVIERPSLDRVQGRDCTASS